MKLKIMMAAGLIAMAAGVANAAEHEVKMLNTGKDGTMVFEPGFLKVAKGDTVKFVPTDLGHNSVSTHVPDGGPTWQGEMNKAVSVTLNTEGVYVYLCVPHTVMAMAGVIQVGAPTNLDAAKASAKELSSKFVIAKDRLDKYMAQVK